MSTSKMMSEKKRFDEMRLTLHVKLTETGEVEKLKELLRTRLVECGWRDEMKALCKAKVRERGIENITVDELVSEITPVGREKVPDSVKKELLQKITKLLESA